jgi:hypothetical protein
MVIYLDQNCYHCHHIQTDSEADYHLFPVRNRRFLSSGQSMKLITHCHLGLRLRMLQLFYSCTNSHVIYCIWNAMAHVQKPDFIFRRNVRVHLNRWGRQFSRLLAAEVCGSAVVMLDTPCSKVVWRVLATHSIHQFPLHFPSHASSCATTFQLDSTDDIGMGGT